MQLKSERQDALLTIRVEGRIDGANAREFEEAVRTSITENDHAVIIDFEKISYISSAGLRGGPLDCQDFWETEHRVCSLFSVGSDQGNF